MEATKGTKRRFKICHDMTLLEEVSSRNPYFSDGKTQIWKDIAQALNKVPLFDKPLDERAIKDRIEILVTAFRADDVRNRVKSGTEEQYDQMQQLLANIDSLIKAQEEMLQKKKRATDEKATEQSRVSKHIRKIGEEGKIGPDFNPALPTTSDGDDAITKAHEDFLDNGGNEDDWEEELDHMQQFGLLAPKKPSSAEKKPGLRGSRGTSKPFNTEEKWILAMKEENNRKYDFKQKELLKKAELREKELEIEKLKLEVEAKKWKALVAAKTG